MITAQEAFQITSDTISARRATFLAFIDKCITDSAKHGETSTNITLNGESQDFSYYHDFLTSLGYKVARDSGGCEDGSWDTIVIKWQSK